jgi:hypothetical protein
MFFKIKTCSVKTPILISHLSAAVITTVVCLLIYGSVQQGYRTAANDPQIQLSSEIKTHLEQFRSIQNIFPGDSVDLAADPGIFSVLYDGQRKVIRSSATLHGNDPDLPKGIFDYVNDYGQDRVTWQPEPGVRMAMVVTKINAPGVSYVAAGRSLKETETREANLLSIAFIAWVICLAVISVHAVVYIFLCRKVH